jgi:hypothetical protein
MRLLSADLLEQIVPTAWGWKYLPPQPPLNDGGHLAVALPVAVGAVASSESPLQRVVQVSSTGSATSESGRIGVEVVGHKWDPVGPAVNWHRAAFGDGFVDSDHGVQHVEGELAGGEWSTAVARGAG